MIHLLFFKKIPEVLFEISQLEVLKMKNNPLKTVSDKLANLQNLKLLNLSYCQFSEWPVW
jgi:Leucine-rich repeat (LRR) protein